MWITDGLAVATPIDQRRKAVLKREPVLVIVPIRACSIPFDAAKTIPELVRERHARCDSCPVAIGPSRFKDFNGTGGRNIAKRGYTILHNR